MQEKKVIRIQLQYLVVRTIFFGKSQCSKSMPSMKLMIRPYQCHWDFCSGSDNNMYINQRFRFLYQVYIERIIAKLKKIGRRLKVSKGLECNMPSLDKAAKPDVATDLTIKKPMKLVIYFFT